MTNNKQQTTNNKQQTINKNQKATHTKQHTTNTKQTNNEQPTKTQDTQQIIKIERETTNNK